MSAMSETPTPQQNHLITALSAEVQSRLSPHLELVSLPLGKVLYASWDTLHHVFFQPTPSHYSWAVKALPVEGSSKVPVALTDSWGSGSRMSSIVTIRLTSNCAAGFCFQWITCYPTFFHAKLVDRLSDDLSTA